MEMITTAQKMLKETASLLLKLKNEEYAENLKVLNGNSIGKHTRHMLDLFDCLLRATQNSQLCYDERERKPEIEGCLESAVNKINDIIGALPSLELDQRLKMTQVYGKTKVQIDTTLSRELMYNIEHSIHHLAIIRIGIEQSFHSIPLADNLGVAYSTLQYRETQKT